MLPEVQGMVLFIAIKRITSKSHCQSRAAQAVVFSHEICFVISSKSRRSILLNVLQTKAQFTISFIMVNFGVSRACDTCKKRRKKVRYSFH
jgi:hypothetical protein